MKIHQDFTGGNILTVKQINNNIFLKNELAFTFESTDFGTENNKVSADRLIEPGRCFAKAVNKYIQSK
ncbi:MAG: hypothetical protein IKT61_05415 [Clostridia bacterium]|nr:hypothetical protein [Clostridia bacterium]